MYEVSLIIEGATNARKRERDNLLFQAWHAAYLSAYAPEKSSKFPRLEKLIGEPAMPTGRRMSAEQIEAVTRSWLGSRHRKKQAGQ